MEIILGLLLLLIATRIFAEGAVRVAMPASVGEIIAGVALAVAIAAFGDQAPLFEEVARSEELALVAEAGIFFLVLQAGVDMRPSEISDSSGRSFVIAIGGIVLPLAAGIAFGWAVLPESELKLAQVFFIGVALSITAIPATVKVLQELGVLHKPFGEAIVTAAIFDDIMGLFLLAVLTSLLGSGSTPSVIEFFWLVGKVAVFFGVTIALGVHVYPRISARLRVLQMASVEFSTLMVVALGYGLLAELLGLHWIMGAFMAGLYFEPRRVGVRAYSEIRLVIYAITTGFLGPLFFASIGLHVRPETIATVPGLVAVLVLVAFLGKFIGAGVPALMAGFNRRESAAIGVGMSARGAVELVVISIAVEAELFCLPTCREGEYMISALILMAVITTMVAPMLLRPICAKLK